MFYSDRNTKGLDVTTKQLSDETSIKKYAFIASNNTIHDND